MVLRLCGRVNGPPFHRSDMSMIIPGLHHHLVPSIVNRPTAYMGRCYMHARHFIAIYLNLSVSVVNIVPKAAFHTKCSRNIGYCVNITWSLQCYSDNGSLTWQSFDLCTTCMLLLDV